MQKKFELAVKNFNKAIQLNPKHANAYFQLAMVLMVKKKTDKAIAALTKVVELQPRNGEAIKLLCQLYNEKKDKSEKAKKVCLSACEALGIKASECLLP